jgi:hypothetical protein
VNVQTVVASSTVRQYYLRLFKLTAKHSGADNIPEIVNEDTGEILIWRYKNSYCSQYAVISLHTLGELTPTKANVKSLLYTEALSGKGTMINCDWGCYSVHSYSSENLDDVMTMGLVVRKILRKIKI